VTNPVKGSFHLVPIQVTPTTSQADSLLNRLLTDCRICRSFVAKVADDLVAVFRKRNADQGLAEITAPWWCLFDLLCHLGSLVPPLS